MSAGNVKTCPKCKAENSDFKIYCGECGSSLSELPSAGNIPIKTASDTEGRTLSNGYDIKMKLRTSVVFGIIIVILPLPFTYLSLDLIIYLSYEGLVTPGLLHGANLMLVIELMFLLGCLIFNREYRLAYVESPVRGILVFLFTFSVGPYIILVMTSQIGYFGLEYSALIVLGVAAFMSWLLFFGWLGEYRPERSLPKRPSQR